MGLIVAIVLGIIVVGGGAYYLGKSGAKKNKSPENILPNNENRKLPEAEKQTQVLSSCASNSTPLINVLAPNGGEVFTLGQNIEVKWNSKCIDTKDFVYLNIGIKDSQAVSELLSDKKVANTGSYDFLIPSSYNLGSFNNNKYILTINYLYGNGEKVSDQSDAFFTINSPISSEESTTEVFNHQPGAIKSINADGANKWILAVDLLSGNPNWEPGVDSTGPFFLNKNTKIRNLNISNSTKIQNCTTQYKDYASGFENDILSFINYADKTIIERGEHELTAYFDINGNNINAIYEQCLP